MNTEITSFNSTFFEYLCGFIWFDQDKLEALMSETGKIYDDSWYYQDGRPTCMFGEHLIGAFPSQTVALVTDELTAAVMSCFPTPYVWLATGKEQATPSDLLPLVGKSVVVFPDKGKYCKWQEMLQAVSNLQFHISDVIEKAQGDCHNIAQMVLSQQPLRPTEEEAALMRMKDANPNIALLVDSLDLEVVDVSSIDEDAMKPMSKSKVKSEPLTQPEDDEAMSSFLLAQEIQWNGRNPVCHKCSRSHEGINGTYCDELHQYVEYGKGNCGR